MKHELTIHSKNILPIIKKGLYSNKDVFLRELISNSIDAIQKAVFLSGPNAEFRIDVKINAAEKRLTISDNGIGMSEEEVKWYISQIAFSGAEDFMNQHPETNALIGQYGLGFFSSFMVADTVEIETKSFQQDSSPVHWACDGSSSYDLSIGTRVERGTDVILHLQQQQEDYMSYTKVKEILRTYAMFLPYPIYLNNDLINHPQPLWLKNHNDCTEKEYIDFFHLLHPDDVKDPIAWVHINMDHPVRAKGILYLSGSVFNSDFHKLKKLQLFCNQVFVTEADTHCFPSAIFSMLRGGIDMSDTPLNASRNQLQESAEFQSLAQHITKKFGDRLSFLLKQNRDALGKNWSHLGPILKVFLLQDENLCKKVMPHMLWQTYRQEGSSQLMTTDEYLASSPQSNKVFYTNAMQETKSHLLSLYYSKGIPVIFTDAGMIDNACIEQLEKHRPESPWQRIDGELPEEILKKNQQDLLLSPSGQTESTMLAERFSSLLGMNDVKVEAKSLASSDIPACILINEKERRMRDYLSVYGGSNIHERLPSMEKIFIINTNNPLIHSLLSYQEKNYAMAKKIARNIYDLTMIQQREHQAQEIAPFCDRSFQFLEACITHMNVESVISK